MASISHPIAVLLNTITTPTRTLLCLTITYLHTARILHVKYMGVSINDWICYFLALRESNGVYNDLGLFLVASLSTAIFINTWQVGITIFYTQVPVLSVTLILDQDESYTWLRSGGCMYVCVCVYVGMCCWNTPTSVALCPCWRTRALWPTERREAWHYFRQPFSVD